MKWGNTAKIDHLMSPARDCGTDGNGASYRYLLCSTARCGSNLVSDMLQQTGLAGDPMEYLNPRYMAGYLRSKGWAPTSGVHLTEYLAEMERRRSTPNGYFGLKAHFEHLQGIYKDRLEQAVPFLQRFDSIILLRRRDKIAQAVSLHKARVTQIWSSLDYQFLDKTDPRRLRKAVFDPIALGRALADILAQDYGWEHLLKRHQLPYHEVWYEDIVADYAGGNARLLAHLGLEEAVTALKAPSIQRQGVDDDPMVRMFREVIGMQFERT